MGRTKPIVLQTTHKSARSGREILLGIKAFNPSELARATLTPVEREKVVASLEESERRGHRSHGLQQLSKALWSNLSSLPRKSHGVADASPRHIAAGPGSTATKAPCGKKKVAKTEQERDAAMLAIDGTARLDPRKANPHAFDTGVTAGMTTRRSMAKQDTYVSDVKSAVGVPHKNAGSSENKNVVAIGDAPGSDLNLPNKAHVEPEDAVESKMSNVPSKFSTLATAAKPTPEASIDGRVTLSGGEIDQATLPAVEGNDSALISTETPNQASKQRSRFEVELETIGTPFVQESVKTAGGIFAKEYSEDGKRWYRQPGSEKPTWAVYERTVDIRRDEFTSDDDTEMSSRGRRLKKPKLG